MKLIIAIISMLVLVSLISLASAETKYTYDSSGRITEARDFDSSGRQTRAQEFDYDSSGRLVKIRSRNYNLAISTGNQKDITTRQTDFVYDDQKNTVTIKDQRGQTATIQKDTNGKITQITYPYGKATNWVYNDQGKVSVIHDPAGGRTRIFYDCDGKVSQIFDLANREMLITKDSTGEIISIDDPVIVPGTLTFEPEIHLDGFKPFNQELDIVDLFPGKLRDVGFAFKSNYDILNKVPGKEISQEDWDKALNRYIEVLKNDVKTQYPSYLRYPSLESSLRQSLTDKARDELLDKLIKENPDLKPGLQKTKSGEDRGKPTFQRKLGIDTEIKREYDSKDRLANIITSGGNIHYEYSDDTNIPSYLANIPSSVTSIAKEDPAEKAEKLKYEKDSKGKVQAITHQIDDNSITHDTLTGQYITGNKDLEKKYDYDLRGFPTEPDKSFITLPGGILPEPTSQKPSINKLVFATDGKTYTKDRSGRFVEVIDGFARDSSGRPVVATGIELVRPAEKDPIRELNLGSDRLAAFSESGNPLGLYTQTNDGPIETKATDGSSLYLHMDPNANVVEVKDKSGKTLNKFTYDPSREELYSETIHEQLQEDLNDRYKLGANNLGKLMELAMGVAPASLVYDESACEQTPTPEPTKPVPTTSPQGDDGQGCRGEKDVCRSYSFNTFEACKKDAYENYLSCKDDCPQGDCIETCYQKYHTTEKDCVAASENQDSACMRAYYFCVKNCPIGGDWQPLSECSNQTPAEPPKCVSITFEIAKTETETERQKASEEEAKCNRACFDAYSDAPNSCSHECDYKKRIDTQDCSNKARQCNRACQNTFVECHEYGCDTRQDELDACEKRCDFEEVACNQPIEPAFKQCQGSCITVRSQCLTGCRTLCPQKVY